MQDQKEKFCSAIRDSEKSMYILAMGIVKNEQDAADVMQNAALKAYCNLDQLRSWKSFRSWILSIVHHTAIEFLRKRRDIACMEDAAVLEIPDTNRETATRVSVWEAVQRVSESCREAIILFYYEGCSLQQIADITGASIPAVKQQLFRGRKQLARLLRKEDFLE